MNGEIIEKLEKHFNSTNLLRGFFLGLGIRHAIDTKAPFIAIIFSVLAPGFYVGINFFNILHKCKL